MTLEEMIAACIEAKQGSKEFDLYFDGAGRWSAQIGEGNPFVRVGEVPGEVSADGATPTEAVAALLETVKG